MDQVEINTSHAATVRYQPFVSCRLQVMANRPTFTFGDSSVSSEFVCSFGY